MLCWEGGSHCNIQGCKLCYYGDYEGRQTYTLFNYYALCNTPAWTGRSWNQGVRCCITGSAWYDNEWGFACRMCDLANYFGKI